MNHDQATTTPPAPCEPEEGEFNAVLESVEEVGATLRWDFRLKPLPYQVGEGVMSLETGTRYQRDNKLASVLASLGYDEGGSTNPHDYIGAGVRLVLREVTDSQGDRTVSIVAHGPTRATWRRRMEKQIPPPPPPEEIPAGLQQHAHWLRKPRPAPRTPEPGRVE